MPELSVLVPTHNRAQSAEAALRRMLEQTLPRQRYEMVVIDSASSDDTPQMLSRLAQEFSNLKIVRADKSGAALARNLGLNALTGDLILMLDDDVSVERDLLERVLAAAKKNPGCVLLGNIVAPWGDSLDPFLRFLFECEDVNTYRFSDAQHVSAQHFYGACVAIPRRALGNLRFDESLGYGEDLDFGMRLLQNTRMVYVPQLAVRHEYYPKFWEYHAKKVRIGYWLACFIQKGPEHAAQFYVEPDLRRWLFRLYRLALAPLAGLAWVYERALRRKGPINRLLYSWYYTDLRVQLYTGMRQYRSKAD